MRFNIKNCRYINTQKKRRVYCWINFAREYPLNNNRGIVYEPKRKKKTIIPLQLYICPFLNVSNKKKKRISIITSPYFPHTIPHNISHWLKETKFILIKWYYILYLSYLNPLFWQNIRCYYFIKPTFGCYYYFIWIFI